MMAVVVDRADLLFAEISQGLKPVRDVLVVAGLFYLSKKLVGITYDVWTGIRIFGLSKLWRPDFRKKYGHWAGTYVIIMYLPYKSNFGSIQFNSRCLSVSWTAYRTTNLSAMSIL